MGPVRRLPFALVGGALLSLSFPGCGLWWLAPLAVSLLALATTEVRARVGLLHGLVFGLAFFGVTRFPSYLPHNETLSWLGHTVHILTGYAIFIFLTLHIGLGIKHQVWDKTRILHRMLPFGRQ